MDTYILILMAVLIIIIGGVVFFGYREITYLMMKQRQQDSAIQSIRGLLDGIIPMLQQSSPMDYSPAEQMRRDAREPEEYSEEYERNIEEEINREREKKVVDEVKNIQEVQQIKDEVVKEGGGDIQKDKKNNLEDNVDVSMSELDQILVGVGGEVADKKRKMPTESPKDLDVGVQREVDGKKYEVYQTSTGQKRWRQMK